MSIRILFAAAFLCFLWGVASAQVELSHQQWEGEQFAAMGDEVFKRHALNLLTFSGAKLVQADAVHNAHFLIDGDVGQIGDTGRANMHGNPSVLTYYLGKPRTIQEINLFSGNIDSRANQDFEIRLALANDPKNPDKRPPFSTLPPTFSSGDKIIGSNSGGFLTTIADASGKPISGNKKYDWIEFKIWRSYPSKVGDPAKEQNPANSWASFLELQVVGDENDPTLFDSQAEKDAWLARRAAVKFQRTLAQRFGEDLVEAIQNPESLKRAINDLATKFPDQYDGKKFLTRYETTVQELSTVPQEDGEASFAIVQKFDELRREALLANPLMQFEQLLFRRAQNAGLEPNWISNAARNKGKYGNALAIVNPQDAGGKATTIIENPNDSFVGDINLHWDAEKILVTALSDEKTWQVFELNIDGTGFKQITPSMGKDVDNVEGCYIPDGSTLFISSASMLGVPCIDGQSVVGNIYRLEADGKTIRQLTFEQDQDWCPILLPNGGVLYLRWEYTDTAHYFTRLLFQMNPDGTNQMAYYGSNSFWPNSLFYAKPIPGSSTKFVGIVSGHHGVERIGELHLFDIQKGRKEADGVIQQIPGYGKPVEPSIKDELVEDSWPKFLFPCPLDENYFLVSAQLTHRSPWCLYLVDTFDNMLKIREEQGFGLYEPTPLIRRPKPPVRSVNVNLSSKESNVFLTDAYIGDGLKNVPKGTVKKFRVFAYYFGYRGIGGHDYIGMESAWDARRMLGEVPVYEDGSASFTIPANTPVAIQPLDEQGRALQLMRTWFIGMPGESQSCTGCHESQDIVTPNKRTTAMGKAPTPIEPFLGPERPFSFTYEVQPVLDRYCVGCHDGSETNRDRPNFADTSPGYHGFSNAYHALHRYVRRPGPESDVHMLKPLEYHASTSELFQRLEKGHHGVQVDTDSMRRLYAWADLNVPYFGTWGEIAAVHKAKDSEAVACVAARYSELRSLYAGIDMNPEKDPYSMLSLPEKIEFVKPPKVQRDYSAPIVPNWPFDASTAKSMQTQPKRTVRVGDLSFEMVWIPSGKFVMGDDGGDPDELPRSVAEIKKPFWMATTETTNALYAQFDPSHDSRFIDQWCKDHTTPGYPANKPRQPVIRITWHEAVKFCQWLSEQTGKKFRLPTEAEWEWACRAGTATPMWYGNIMTDSGEYTDFGKFENLADMSTKLFVVHGVNPQPKKNPLEVEAFIPRAEGINDGNMIAEDVGGYQPNPWGLHDMHGSVAEWTNSDYKPYPYSDSQLDMNSRKVVRGGSWHDKPQRARSGMRRAYEPWQPVSDVGFRVVYED